MKPVYQTRWGEGKGNCFQASVASLFELELDDVPDFCNEYKDYEGQWHEEFSKWLNKFGYCCISCTGSQESLELKSLKNCYILGAVKNEEGLPHSVIYKNGKIVHDPNFWAECKYEVFQLDLIMPLDPVKKENL